MSNEVHISAIAYSQAPQLAALHQASFDNGVWSLEQIQDSIKLETTQGFVAFDGNEIVGLILCQVMSDQTEILTFCVHPARQRQKIGEALLQKILTPGTTVFLEVAADNVAACNLYKKLGFKVIGSRPGYYKRGNDAINALTFKLTPFASASGAC